MSSVLVLVISLLGRFGVVVVRMFALLARRWTLIHDLPALLLLAGGGRVGLQAVDHHSTGDGPEDQCACNQDRSDQAKPVEEASYHVITNYQRGPGSDRSLCRQATQSSAVNRST